MAAENKWSSFRHFSESKAICSEDGKEGLTMDRSQWNTDLTRHKPSGLYLAPHDDWLKWCKKEQFVTQDYQFEHRLDENDAADLKILCVTTQNELEVMTEYASPSDARQGFLLRGLDWVKLTKEYDGMHVCRELATGQVISQSTAGNAKWYWTMYDVETLVIWKAGVRVHYVGPCSFNWSSSST